MSAFLSFENLSKRFGRTRAVDGVSLQVEQGEIFSLLGPSGCGKTTLLRIAAGLEAPDGGRVYLDGKDITDLPPNRRQVNTIFQNYALFPHLSVRENIAFGLRVARRPAREIREEVGRMLALIQMEEQADRKPDQISGGQKQRVAIARALVNRPQVLLLDEPLAALDLKLRQRMLIELDLIHDEVGTTFLYVTHDQGEAMGLSDRIAVMHEGAVQQVGTPPEIYEKPQTSFVAAFIGDTNFFDGTVSALAEDEYSRLSIEGLGEVLCWNDRPTRPGQGVHLSVRPERFTVTRTRPDPAPHVNLVAAKVEDIIYLGGTTKYWVRVGEHRIAVHRQHRRFLLDEEPITWNDPVWLSWHADDGFMLDRYREADEDLLAVPPEEVGDPSPAEAAGPTEAEGV